MNPISYILTNINGFNNIMNDTKNDEFDVSNILKLNNVECKTSNNTTYRVIRYDKNFLSRDLIYSYGLCRSVIVNNDKN